MDAFALVVGAERDASLVYALGRIGVRCVVVDDAIGAMSAIGRAEFRVLVFMMPLKSTALPLRALWRVAQMRHPGIALVHMSRGDQGVAGDAVYALPVDATDDVVLDHVQRALAAFEPSAPFELPPDTLVDEGHKKGPLLEGTLARGGAPAVLASIFAQELTGKLQVEGQPAIYFASGEPVAVDVSVELVSAGAPTQAATRAPTESATAVLRVHRERVRDRVLAFIETAEGPWSFFEDREFLDTRLLSKVSTFGMILESRRAKMDPASVMSSFSTIANQYLWPAVGIEKAAKRLLPFTRGVDVAPLMSGKGTVQEFLAGIGLDPLMGTLVVLTLVDGGLATLSPTPSEWKGVTLGDLEADPNPFDLNEMGYSGIGAPVDDVQERVSQLYVEMKPATDPHVILGVREGASDEEIEAAYRKRLADLNIEEGAPSLHARLDELRRKADLARDQLLGKDRPTAAPKTHVGRYELIRSLGQGGMAEVFLGRQIGVAGFAKRVVVKRILERYSSDPDIVRMFLEEARIAARITHPNVVQIFDLGEAGGEYYIVMEYVEGLDFAALLALAQQQAQPVPFELAAYVVAEACAGLHAAHSHLDDHGRACPIVHRDISTQNVLVSVDGHVKIADFGVAKRADAANQTMPGLLKGKPAYLAPEYIRGSPADARSDVFAAGLVLYTAITGVHPFDRMTPMQSMKAILAGDLPPPESLREDIPPLLRSVIARSLAHDVNQRFQTAHAFRLALLSFIAAHGQPMSEVQLGEWVLNFSRPIAAPVPEAEDFEHEERTVELSPLHWPYENKR